MIFYEQKKQLKNAEKKVSKGLTKITLVNKNVKTNVLRLLKFLFEQFIFLIPLMLNYLREYSVSNLKIWVD